MKEFKGIIYQAINIQNGKSYIGKTIKPLSLRIDEHRRASIRFDYKTFSKFYSSIKKYGFCNFKWLILGECFSEDELNLSEKECISFFDTTNGLYGMNINTGGRGGDTITNHPERDKIIERQSKNHPLKGKTPVEVYGKARALEIDKQRVAAIKNKTYEEIMGEERGKELRLTRSKFQKNRVRSEKELNNRARLLEEKRQIKLQEQDSLYLPLLPVAISKLEDGLNFRDVAKLLGLNRSVLSYYIKKDINLYNNILKNIRSRVKGEKQ